MGHAPSEHVRAAVERILQMSSPPLEKAEALVEVAAGLQRRPKDAQELWDAIFYLDRAVEVVEGDPLATARARAGRGSALRRLPGSDIETLVRAREDLSAALPVLRELGSEDEAAEVEMSYGLVVQTLAAANRGNLADAVSAYQRALRIFRKDTHPREYATLHNNLATAYLSMKLSPERDKMKEALAVQSFQAALEVVTLIDDPVEYAMLQSNLGNALQSVRSTHRIPNLRRALEAYDEALRVRTPHDMPVEHANTLSNKANALMNLPDDDEHPERGNPENLRAALEGFGTARALFEAHGLLDRAAMVGQLVEALSAELEAPAGGSPS